MNAVVRAPSPALRSFEAQWRSQRADALAAWRNPAMQRLIELGLPSVRDESWRYTSLRTLLAQSYAAAPESGPAMQAPAATQWLTDNGAIPSIVVVNGVPLLAPEQAQRDGLEVYSLRELALQDPARVAPFLAERSESDRHRWQLLNTALFTDGLYVHVRQTTEIPLCIVHVTSATGMANATYPRVIIEAAAGTHATIIQHFLDTGPDASLCNSFTQVALAASARLEHYRVFAGSDQATQFDAFDVRQQRDSHCKQFTMVLGGGLVRCSLDSQLQASGAELDSYSLLVGSQQRHVDCVAVATHAAPATRSRQTVRSIASGTSRAICNSTVVVAAGAAHAESQQSCRGMLLSPTAEIDSRPQLEIHADEVKCAHGATTGRLDREMFFYLLSRGLDRDTAQSLLVFAFLSDVLTGMSLPSARAAIEAALIAQLPDAERLSAFR